MALSTLLRRWGEWLFGRWYEGPTIPPRLLRQASVWARSNTHATRKEWLAFAEDFARCAYESGWQRGYEYVERSTPVQWSTPPEEIADTTTPTWRDIPIEVFDLLEPNEIPLDLEWPDEPTTSIRPIQRLDGLPL